jgi:ATP phosphoribosyltransferase regulatory subunit
MPTKSAARAEAARLFACSAARAPEPVEADILQPAETLLDLYGEDIRARAYVTADPLRGEMMLRPDFTVPVVQMHMANGAEPARYTYMGEVFRQAGTQRPAHIRVPSGRLRGLRPREPGDADAEVFALFARRWAPLGLTAGDRRHRHPDRRRRGAATTDARKRALMRHLWRPRRFRALLDRFGGRTPAVGRPQAPAQPPVAPRPRRPDRHRRPAGRLRGADEIEARIAALLRMPRPRPWRIWKCRPSTTCSPCANRWSRRWNACATSPWTCPA